MGLARVPSIYGSFGGLEVRLCGPPLTYALLPCSTPDSLDEKMVETIEASTLRIARILLYSMLEEAVSVSQDASL